MKILSIVGKWMRTSEFWLLLAQAAVETMHAPVPDQYKTMAWVYIGARILSKVVKAFPDGAAPPAAVLAIGLLLMPAPSQAGGTVWQATNLGFGAQGVWNEQTPSSSNPRDFEAFVSPSVSITPHVSVVGEGVYGFDRSYFGAQGGVRLTATDVDNQNFSVGIGFSRHWVSEHGVGLNEGCGEAVLGWVPFPQLASTWVVQAKTAYGLDTGGLEFRAALKFVPKRAR